MSTLPGTNSGAKDGPQIDLPSIALVQCHTMQQPHLERREQELATLLSGMGHRTAFFGMAERSDGSRLPGSFATTFFPPDDVSLLNNARLSTALVDAIAAFAPDIVLFKGLGYRILDAVTAAQRGRSRFGVILGGSWRSDALREMRFIFVEYARQTELIRENFGCESALFFEMPKLIPWDLVPASPPEAPRWDACCVSAFIDRKNHVALRDLFGRYRLALVGEGPERAAIEAMAASLEPEARPVFTGNLSRQGVLDVMAASRLLVHPSKWEGLPRVAIEGFACGLPLVALNQTLGAALGGLPFVHLCEESDFCRAVTDRLADSDWLVAMSTEARRYALEHYGPLALRRTAEEFSAAARSAAAPVPITSNDVLSGALPSIAPSRQTVACEGTRHDDRSSSTVSIMRGKEHSMSRSEAKEIEYEGFRFSLDHPSITPDIVTTLRERTYERTEARLVRLALRPGDRVLELGTGMGFTAMVCASIVGAANVLSFEASPVMREIALRNFALNGLDVRCRQQIVQPRSRFTGSAEFYLAPSIMSSATRARRGREKLVLEAVAAETVIAAERANVLVMDVEGYEAEFLTKTDLTGIDRIICECHYRKAGRAAINRMVKKLYRRGFFIDLAASVGEVVLLHRGAGGPDKAARSGAEPAA